MQVVYEYLPFSITPFEITSDFPEGDHSNPDSLTWTGVLNVSITIPKNTPIPYPPEYDSNVEHQITVDIMKCTDSKFKRRNFFSLH